MTRPARPAPTLDGRPAAHTACGVPGLPGVTLLRYVAPLSARPAPAFHIRMTKPAG
jgi:hypothetical protein